MQPTFSFKNKNNIGKYNRCSPTNTCMYSENKKLFKYILCIPYGIKVQRTMIKTRQKESVVLVAMKDS